MESTVWLNYDLGIRGDHRGLFRLLDSLGAKECGVNQAVFKFHHSGNLVDELKQKLSNEVKLDDHSKIYVAYRDNDAQKNRGTFIVGNRRQSPWSGYASATEPTFDE